MEKTHLDGIEDLFDIVRVRRHRLVHKKFPSAPVNTYSLPWETFSCGSFKVSSFTFFRVLNGQMLLSVLMLDKVHRRPEFSGKSDICNIGRKASDISKNLNWKASGIGRKSELVGKLGFNLKSLVLKPLKLLNLSQGMLKKVFVLGQ